MSWVLSAFADEAVESIDGQIQALQRAQIRNVDLRLVDGYNISELPLDRARQVQKRLHDAALGVCMFGSPIGKIDIAEDFRIDLDKLVHLGKLADVFPCRSVRIFSYFNKGRLSMDRWRNESLSRLQRLRDLAAELNLVLYHENEKHIFGDHCAQIMMLAEQIRDGEVFKLIFDFDNFHQSGDDVWENWLLLRDSIDAFHLKDSDQNKQHVPVGQGAGCVRQILEDARSRSFCGPLSVEPHLKHSVAVMATGAHGNEYEAFADMTAADCFQRATEVAIRLLEQVQAPLP